MELTRYQVNPCADGRSQPWLAECDGHDRGQVIETVSSSWQGGLTLRLQTMSRKTLAVSVDGVPW